MAANPQRSRTAAKNKGSFSMKLMQAAVAALVALSVVPLPSFSQPPAHAKAHGWRKMNDPSYAGYEGRKWEKDYGITEGTCNTAAVGAVLGGVAGGVIGSQVGKGEDRPVAIVVGTVLGAVIGHEIGAQIDSSDRACMGHALELAGESRTVSWTNAATGVSYVLTPTRNFKEGARPCREFTARATKASEASAKKGQKGQAPVRAVACRKGNGEWEMRKL
jgi:surface antigen